jgi:hypothetical protein
MRIRLHNGRLLADLISHLREGRCIAYVHSQDSIEVLRPTRGAAEASEIRQLLDEWSAANPDADPEIVT